MKCRDCPDYKMCSSAYDLRIIRKKCEKAKWRKSITNADRIRAMTDEELADFLHKNRGGCRALTTESYVCDSYTENLDTDCKACWLDWLKQEVTDG